MEVPEPRPLATLKSNVRKRVEEWMGCELKFLDSRGLARIGREIDGLRAYCRSVSAGGCAWEYGASRDRLIAYALAYFPYHVELVSYALAAMRDELRERDWDSC